jgi:putative hemolysin
MWKSLAIVALSALGACTSGQGEAQPARAVGMANPASVHCANLRGASEIREGPGGQYGMCRLPDGKVCEEWALYRDKVCQPAT